MKYSALFSGKRKFATANDTYKGKSTKLGNWVHMTVDEICCFIALIILMGSSDWNTTKDYWLTNELILYAIH
jgi:hypothetical protein